MARRRKSKFPWIPVLAGGAALAYVATRPGVISLGGESGQATGNVTSGAPATATSETVQASGGGGLVSTFGINRDQATRLEGALGKMPGSIAQLLADYATASSIGDTAGLAALAIAAMPEFARIWAVGAQHKWGLELATKPEMLDVTSVPYDGSQGRVKLFNGGYREISMDQLADKSWPMRTMLMNRVRIHKRGAPPPYTACLWVRRTNQTPAGPWQAVIGPANPALGMYLGTRFPAGEASFDGPFVEFGEGTRFILTDTVIGLLASLPTREDVTRPAFFTRLCPGWAREKWQ